MSVLALFAATAPLPPQLPPERRAEDVTLPLVELTCALEQDGGEGGRLEFTTSGGRAFDARSAPQMGRSIEHDSDFRRTEQIVRISRDDLGIFSNAKIADVRISEVSGEIKFRSRLPGTTEVAWWRFVVFADAASRYRAALVDARGSRHLISGVCDMRVSLQTPLGTSEIAMDANQ